jgi:adenine-specific DNA methylase
MQSTTGSSVRADAKHQLLSDDSCSAVFTDPPYYDAIAYADLSDFFYVWLKRTLSDDYPEIFKWNLVEKEHELVQLSKRFHLKYKHKTNEFFESGMQEALTESRRIVKPTGIGVVVFAHKSTSGWEAQLKAMIAAGWKITASWPIDTERPGSLNHQNNAHLASSVQIVCRPRENEDGSLIENLIGDWRDVQEELPKRIHEWMPRLAEEGVAGADAIFACLGPALEIFSRYTKVVQAGSEREISLREYLEKVWAAVSRR